MSEMQNASVSESEALHHTEPVGKTIREQPDTDSIPHAPDTGKSGSETAALKSPAHWAAHYVGTLRFAITKLRPGQKKPTHAKWNSEPWDAARGTGYFTDPESAAVYYRQHPRDGIGVVHGPSGTAAFDVDHREWTQRAFAAVGLDLDAVLAEAAVRIEGNPAHAKALRLRSSLVLSWNSMVNRPYRRSGRNTFLRLLSSVGSLRGSLLPSLPALSPAGRLSLGDIRERGRVASRAPVATLGALQNIPEIVVPSLLSSALASSGGGLA
jgi:hypothetical protein